MVHITRIPLIIYVSIFVLERVPLIGEYMHRLLLLAGLVI